MALFDGIPTFDDDHNLSAEDLNSFRSAIVQVFTQGVEAENIKWPLVALGILDMNNYQIINVGSISNVIHVNSTNSLAQAISDLPSAGGTIVIDPGFEATTTAAGLTIDKDYVSIYGEGKTSGLSCDGPEHGLLVTGDHCTVRGLTLSGPAPMAVISTGDHNDISDNVCDGVGGIQIGNVADFAQWNSVYRNHFINTGESNVTLTNVSNLQIGANDIYNTHATGKAITYDGSGSNHLSVNLSDNTITCSGSTGVCFDNQLAGSSSHRTGLLIEGNKMKCIATTGKCIDMPDFQDFVIGPNTLQGDVYLGGTDGSLASNMKIINLFLFGTSGLTAEGNNVSGNLIVGNDGSADVTGAHNRVINNSVGGAVVVPPTSDPGTEVYTGNMVAGDESSVQRLVDESIIVQYHATKG